MFVLCPAFLFLGLCAAGRKTTKPSIREFKLASRSGLYPWLDERGAFVGDGAALLTKDIFGNFAPLPRRELEAILSAGYKIAVDLGSRMHGLAALAKALNQRDYALAALAAIVLAQLQFPASDKGAAARINMAAAMLEHGASAAEVLKQFLPKGSPPSCRAAGRRKIENPAGVPFGGRRIARKRAG